jgi:predicted RNA-binding protein YlxR (DUF448 family)
MRDRRCIVTGRVRPESQLVRFVADPDANIVADIAATLPGRGFWVSADRQTVAQAVAKNHFSRAARRPVKTDPDLAARVEKLLVQRMANDLGLARRAGELTLGFDQVLRGFDAKYPVAALVEAADGAADGKRKLAGAARAKGLRPALIDLLTAAELSLALGRENVIHASLKPGRLAERLIFDAGRLKGFRSSELSAAAAMPGRVRMKGTDEPDR